jgi:sugar lactone lactonase YvrE
MQKPLFFIGSAAGAAAAALLLAGSAEAQNMNVIPIAVGAQAESIAATPDGGLIIGTTAGTIYRVAPGAQQATEWITGLQGFTLGVFAVDNTAYVCNGPALRTFDLTTAEPGPVYEFANATGICNDIAVSPDGTIFVSETAFGGAGSIRALVAGEDGLALQTVVAGAGIGGLDGLAFVGGVLYANDVLLDRLYRIDLDGINLTGLTTLSPNQAVDGPDGMRVTEDGAGVFQANNGTREIVHITFDGDAATVTTLAGGFPAATAVAQIGNTLYVVGAMFGDAADPSAMTYVHTIDLE